MRTRHLAALAAAMALATTAAHADPDEDQRKREGSALFVQAQALLKQGKLDEACVKFREAYDRDKHAVGTVLNIGKCQARQGKIASAVATFKDARDLAKAVSSEAAQQLAEEQLQALTPFVPHVTLAFDARPAVIEIFIDTVKVDDKDAADLPIDPGRHMIEVRSPGMEAQVVEVRVEKSEKKTVQIPALKAKRGGGHEKSATTGIVVTAGGVAVLGAGVVIGLIASGKYSTARDGMHCDGNDPPTCDATGKKDVDSAQSLGNVGTVVGIVGVAAAIGGGYLWWSAARSHKHRVVVAPDAGPEHVGVLAVGRF